MLHYTDEPGFKAISSQSVWHFKAAKPPGPHPAGAYFTTLRPDAPLLCKRLRLPRRKIQWVFEFAGEFGLRPIKGGRAISSFTHQWIMMWQKIGK